MSTYAVIMAGGSGKRFWPASRKARPKQLLPLAPGDDRTLLRATLDRIASLVPSERVLVVTSEALAEATAAELSDLPRENILAEPMGRNTAPCIGWAAAHVARKDPDGTLLVLPADHHIGKEKAYLDVLRAGIEAAQSKALVTVGLKPTRPETGYGYLEVGEEKSAGVFSARRFVEKPNRQRAEQLLASGALWNSGIFFFRADAILAAIEAHLPGLSIALKDFDAAAAEGKEAEVVGARYGELPNISVDHGIMEKADDVLVVPGEFGWSDLGSWTSAWELATQDNRGNAAGTTTADADKVLVDTDNCYVTAPAGKLVALVGVKDLVVVDTPDALLVMPREEAQRVREVVSTLETVDDKRL